MAIEKGSLPLASTGNPVWEDIQLRTRSVDGKHRYAIQVVCDHSGTIFYAAQGDWDEAYEDACNFVSRNFGHAVAEPYDFIIAVVYPPLDRNLYQLQKSFENVAVCVREGGAILVVAGCQDGVGDDRFVKLARLSEDERTKVLQTGDHTMGIHKVVRTKRLAEKQRLYLVATLKDSDLRPLPISLRHELGPAVNELTGIYGSRSKIAVVLDSASQVLHQKARKAQPKETKEKRHA